MTGDLRYDDPHLVREPMTVADGGRPGSVLALLERMRKSAFQGRKVGEAFGRSDIWMSRASSMMS